MISDSLTSLLERLVTLKMETLKIMLLMKCGMVIIVVGGGGL